jgi:hypothetical protein
MTATSHKEEKNLTKRKGLSAMTPSQRAKELGCKSLAQVAEKTEQSERTLINWFNNPKKRKLFEIVCIGVSKEG